ncbi:hypothetical protein SMICM304S_03028 [Streptomyces microflavus]
MIALVPRSAVGAGLRRARDMLDYKDAGTVAAVLGNGRRTSAHDTVPFALWSAARSLGDFEEAFWVTAQAGGRRQHGPAPSSGASSPRGRPGRRPPHGWHRPRNLPAGWSRRTTDRTAVRPLRRADGRRDDCHGPATASL